MLSRLRDRGRAVVGPRLARRAAAVPVAVVLAVLGVLGAAAGRLVDGHPVEAGLLMALALVTTVAVPLPRVLWQGLVLALWLVWGTVCALTATFSPPSAVAVLVATGVVVAADRRVEQLREGLAELRTAADEASVRDGLTGVLNDRGLAMLGAPMLEAARRQGGALHCLLVDVDDWTALNERLSADDRRALLVGVAEALSDSVRGTDAVSRRADATFCVVGPGAGMPPLELERRLRERLVDDPAVPLDRWDPALTAGSGVLAPWDSGDLASLLDLAAREMERRRALRRTAPGARAMQRDRRSAGGGLAEGSVERRGHEGDAAVG